MDGNNHQSLFGGNHIEGAVRPLHVKHREAGGLDFGHLHTAALPLPRVHPCRVGHILHQLGCLHLHPLARPFVPIGHIALRGGVLLQVNHLVANLPRTEVYHRLVVDIVDTEHQHHRQRSDKDDAVALKAAFLPQVAGQHDPHRRHVKHDILPEGLPVRQLDGIAETATVVHQVRRCVDKCRHREEGHHQRQQPCREYPEGIAYQHHPHQELGTYQRHGKHARQRVRPLEAHTEKFPVRHIVLHLEHRPHRVHTLHEGGEQEHQSHDPPRDHVQRVIQLCILDFHSSRFSIICPSVETRPAASPLSTSQGKTASSSQCPYIRLPRPHSPASCPHCPLSV